MPYLYGKTIISFADDVIDHYNNTITRQHAYFISNAIVNIIQNDPSFIKSKIFMNSLTACTKLLSCANQPTKIVSMACKSVISYNKLKSTLIRYYRNNSKNPKKYCISETLLENDRPVIDSRRSTNAICANYIHFLDAHVCQSVCNLFKKKIGKHEPLATIHDCFITNYEYIDRLPQFYIESLCKSTLVSQFSYNRFIIYTTSAVFYQYCDNADIKEIFETHKNNAYYFLLEFKLLFLEMFIFYTKHIELDQLIDKILSTIKHVKLILLCLNDLFERKIADELKETEKKKIRKLRSNIDLIINCLDKNFDYTAFHEYKKYTTNALSMTGKPLKSK